MPPKKSRPSAKKSTAKDASHASTSGSERGVKRTAEEELPVHVASGSGAGSSAEAGRQVQAAKKSKTKKATSKTKRKVGKAVAYSGEELNALRRNANERAEHLERLVDGLNEDQCKGLLKKLGAEQPGVVLDLMDLHAQPVPEEPQPAPQPPNRDVPQPPNRAVPHWCVCGHCRLMSSAIEDVCCRQQPDNCLGETPEMTALCIDYHVLELSMLYRADVLGIERLRQADVRLKNSSLRYAGYRQHTLWQHGRLGRGVRRVIPSCCIWKIRDAFPDPSNQYVPFQAGEH